MSDEVRQELVAFLQSGRELLEGAVDRYNRALTPEEYWWLGVGLAACTLAELGGKTYAVGRIEQLIERLGHNGAKGDWLQRMVEELAELDAEGLLWPVYARSGEGPVVPTGVTVNPEFGPRSGFIVALAHIGVALAVHREDQALVEALAGAIGEIVESDLSAEGEAVVLGALH